jgi:hypothetical protein
MLQVLQYIGMFHSRYYEPIPCFLLVLSCLEFFKLNISFQMNDYCKPLLPDDGIFLQIFSHFIFVMTHAWFSGKLFSYPISWYNFLYTLIQLLRTNILFLFLYVITIFITVMLCFIFPVFFLMFSLYLYNRMVRLPSTWARTRMHNPFKGSTWRILQWLHSE